MAVLATVDSWNRRSIKNVNDKIYQTYEVIFSACRHEIKLIDTSENQVASKDVYCLIPYVVAVFLIYESSGESIVDEVEVDTSEDILLRLGLD